MVPGDATVIEPLFAAEDDVEPPAQLVGRKPHDLVVRVLEQRLAVQRYLYVRRKRVALAQIAELRQLPAERPLVRYGHTVRTFRSKTMDSIKHDFIPIRI